MPAVLRSWPTVGASLLALAVAVGLVASCADQPPPSPPAVETTLVRLTVPPRRPPQPLDAFLTALQRLQAGQSDRLVILQLGDSHTAGDVFSGRLRALFQERFGDAGRGLMVAGHAYDGLRQAEVAVAQTGRWTYDNSQRNPPSGGPYGITGFVAHSRQAGARMTFTPAAPEGFTRAVIDYLVQPGGGHFALAVDGRLERHVATGGAGAPRFASVEVAAPAGSHALEIRAEDGGDVALLGVALERRGRGVIYDSAGVSGATVGVIDRWNPRIVEAEIRSRRPSLIVLAYGTNEGFQPELDGPRYRDAFADLINRLHRIAPDASVLVVGPPDGKRQDPGCPKAWAATGRCSWTTPANLAVVRAMQREAAAAAGAAFWDWSQLMTGPGRIDDWINANPPLARADHVHFTSAGYTASADALFEMLMDRFRAFRGIRTTSTTF